MRPHEILAELGNCREQDPNVMYPDMDDERAVAIAKSVCNGCVVIDLCREEALDSKEKHGVWAGMDSEERRLLAGKIAKVRRGQRRTN